MKKTFTKLLASAVLFLTVGTIFAAETPDFSCVGFAAQNGGTTGGQGGQEVTVINLTQLKKYVSEKDATPRIIYVKGTLEGAGGGEIVSIGSNKTIIGIGTEGKVSKVQFYCKNSKNLIFRNLFFSMENSTLGSDADCISIATTGSAKCQNIWIDHCTFDNNMQPVANASASLKDKYDGLLDIKKNSEYITISWCVFKNHYKGILVGYTTSDTYDRKITMHHNAFINISSRTPSYRGGTAHVYNNYWDGCKDASTGKYFSTGVNCREEACVYVESNYFKNMNRTIYCAWDDVSKPGYAFWQNNTFENAATPESDSQFQSCNSFTPPYTVNVDNVDDVPGLVEQYAGIGILTDPVTIPDPEDGGETPKLDAPIVNEASNITETGFDISWNTVTDATQYIVNISYEDDGLVAPTPVFTESFNNFTTSITSGALASGKTDNPVSKYKPNGSSAMLCAEDGTMDLSGGRFCILNLDLSMSPTLYLKCKYISGSGRFVVTYAEGTSQDNAAYKESASTIGSNWTTLEIPLTGTTNSLIQLRTESSTVIRIDQIIIGAAGLGSTITETYTVNAPQTSYSFSDLTPGIEYFVEVVAKNAAGETSNSSNAVYATPGSSSGSNLILSDKGEPISVQYFTITGIQIKEPTSGLFIKRIEYADGTVESEKLYVK